MHRVLCCWGLLLVGALAGVPARAQEARLANGMAIKGEVGTATAEGLEIQTPAGPKTYPWAILSAGTRYRYQPVYKANFQAIQEGKPPAERKPVAAPAAPVAPAAPALPAAPAAPAEAPAPAAPAAAPAAPAAPAPAAAPAAPAAPPVGKLGFANENPKTIHPKEFPNAKLRDKTLTIYQAIQYGPAADEVVFLALDTKTPDDPYDVLFVYAPASSQFAKTAKVEGQKKGSGDKREVVFRKVPLTAKCGPITANYEVECTYALRKLILTVQVEVIKGAQRSKFTLYLEPNDLFYTTDVPITVKRLFDLPVVVIQSANPMNKRVLSFGLRMADFFMLPVDGMEKKMDIGVVGGDGKTVEKDMMKMDFTYVGNSYGASYELKKVKAGQNYTVQAVINLGPVFGAVKAETKVEIPGGD